MSQKTEYIIKDTNGIKYRGADGKLYTAKCGSSIPQSHIDAGHIKYGCLENLCKLKRAERKGPIAESYKSILEAEKKQKEEDKQLLAALKKREKAIQDVPMVLEKAKQEANSIIEKAKKEAEKIIADAEKGIIK